MKKQSELLPKKQKQQTAPPVDGTPVGKRKAAGEAPLHRVIYEELLGEIRRQVFRPGDRLPSEAMLCDRFQASRITVGRALQSLQRDHLVTRRAGSGTYVEAPRQETSRQFGLLIPEFGSTEIFEPICRGMVLSAQGRSHSLSWGSLGLGNDASPEAAESLCQQYIAQGVDGVFFAPMEHLADNALANQRIAAALLKAQMPTVLLDRTITAFPEHDRFDCVGIDHYAAGFVLTRHLLAQGAKRIVFVARPYAASSVDARFAGYAQALTELADGFHASPRAERRRLPGGSDTDLRTLVDELAPDALLCANDITAATIMQTLQGMGIRVPEDVRMAGVDDVRYAQFLPVPLTTLRQNCGEIGAAAMSTMLERIERPDRPARAISVEFELVVRASCGAALERA